MKKSRIYLTVDIDVYMYIKNNEIIPSQEFNSYMRARMTQEHQANKEMEEINKDIQLLHDKSLELQKQLQKSMVLKQIKQRQLDEDLQKEKEELKERIKFSDSFIKSGEFEVLTR